MGRCGRGPGTSLARALLSVISKTAILSSCSLCPASHFVLAPILSCCSLCPGAHFALLLTLSCDPICPGDHSVRVSYCSLCPVAQFVLVINPPGCLSAHCELVSGCSVLLKTIVSRCLPALLFTLSWCYCCSCEYHVMMLLFSLR